MHSRATNAASATTLLFKAIMFYTIINTVETMMTYLQAIGLIDEYNSQKKDKDDKDKNKKIKPASVSRQIEIFSKLGLLLNLYHPLSLYCNYPV